MWGQSIGPISTELSWPDSVAYMNKAWAYPFWNGTRSKDGSDLHSVHRLNPFIFQRGKLKDVRIAKSIQYPAVTFPGRADGLSQPWRH